MRNLKKVFAVILTVALLATSLMVPALAAVSNEAEALKLQKIGLFAGNPEDLKLDEGVTRIQGLAFAIRAAGKEKEAFAMTDEEVAAELAKFTDSSAIPAWGVKYAAYAIKHGITVGVGNNKFAALDPISGTSFLVFLMKSGMGYADVTTANVIDVAVEAKVLTAGQAVTYASKAALIRDDAAAILYGAAKNGVNANGKTFIQSLIDAGFVTKEAAVEAGFVAAEPEKFEVVDVYADNLKEVVVTFNREVNKDTVDTSDFDVDGDTPDDVSVDGKVVTLTMADADILENDTEYTLSVSDLEDLDENVIEATEIDFTVHDVELPTLESISFTGPQTAKLTFSEPIDPNDLGDASVTVDNGVYSATFNNTNVDGNVVEVDLGTELEEGTHEFKVKGFKDYVPYVMITKTIKVEYVDVDDAPVVTVKEASQTKVVLSFDRPVKGFDVDNFYHTYSSWKPLSIEVAGGTLDTDKYYDEVTLRFTDDNSATTDRPLPEGKVKIVVLAEAGDNKIEDKWGNGLDKDVELTVTISADNTPPAVKKITVVDNQTVKIYFTEDVNEASAEKAANIKITNPDGKEVKSYDYNRTYDNTSEPGKYFLQIDFDRAQDDGTYKVKLSGIKDVSLSENEIEEVTLSFDISNKTGISLQNDVTVTCVDDEDILYVAFSREMMTSGQYSVLDPANYQWAKSGDPLADLDADDVTISLFTKKIVKIAFKGDVDLAGSSLAIARVKDAKGNFSQEISYTHTGIGEEEGPVITAVKKVADNKFELTVNKELKSVKATGIKIDGNGDGVATTAANISFTNDGDKTVIKVTVAAAEKHAGTGPITAPESGKQPFKIVTVAGNIKSVTGAYMGDAEYKFGETVGVEWKDGVAPEFAKVPSGDNKDKVMAFVSGASGTLINEIKIVYSEVIDSNSVSKYTYKVGGYTVVSATASGNTVVLSIRNDDKDETDDTDATPTLTQVYSIEDLEGNTFLPDDAIEVLGLGAPLS